uniref:dynein axonemal heavy chain 6-like n=1 Tax=Pristiophorus japonicus TaxID=55135 RepID=UPI00398F57CE
MVLSTQALITKGVQLSSLAGSIMSGTPKSKQTNQKSLVCTVDIVRYSFLTSLLLLNKCPVLLTGESGVGKSAIIQELLSKLQKPKGSSIQTKTILGNVFLFNEMKHESMVADIGYLADGFSEDVNTDPSCIDGVCSGPRMEFPTKDSAQAGTKSSQDSKELQTTTVLFSTQTTSAQTQAQILHKLVKRSGNRRSPPKYTKLIVFVDDLNMPAVEQYGAQPPLELIRQFLDLGGFFDMKRLRWLRVEDVALVAACAPPSGARSELSQRLLKHFCIFNLPQHSTKALQYIFQVKVGLFLESNNFMPVVRRCRELLVKAAISIYYKMCRHMLPTPINPHYTFNVRDLIKVTQGLLQANETDIVSKEQILMLFAHEVTRVFHDRLSDVKDRQMFYTFLSDDLHNYFKVTEG